MGAKLTRTSVADMLRVIQPKPISFISAPMSPSISVSFQSPATAGGGFGVVLNGEISPASVAALSICFETATPDSLSCFDTVAPINSR